MSMKSAAQRAPRTIETIFTIFFFFSFLLLVSRKTQVFVQPIYPTDFTNEYESVKDTILRSGEFPTIPVKRSRRKERETIGKRKAKHASNSNQGPIYPPRSGSKKKKGERIGFTFERIFRDILQSPNTSPRNTTFVASTPVLYYRPKGVSVPSLTFLPRNKAEEREEGRRGR